ncbi:MAG TPA: Nif3-like dinuclear metal center hexameric protein [Firmicutes bacterium]|nr:Nif3-like dinuclear metal center hexameric protein [Bacillota bacterium]
MSVNGSYVANLIEKLAPRHLAEDWDNVGWQVGDSRNQVTTVLVSLDPSPGALTKAEQLGAQLLVTHHPLFFRPLKHLRLDLPSEQLVAKFLRANIGVYSAHTNLDKASKGTSDVLAQKLGLINNEILAPDQGQKLYKLVSFVPSSHVENVRQALAAAGAGWIGNYSHCTFQVAGTGTFMPLEGTKPYIGHQGTMEYVDELRLETVVPEENLGKAVSRLLSAHPYEEVAYDIYPLAREGRSYGLGLVGELPQSMSLTEFAKTVKKVLGLPSVNVVGDENKQITRVAVCGGSGSSLIGRAKFVGADVLVTGDVKYHDALEAELIGLSVVDGGHDGTENPVVLMLANYLADKLNDRQVDVHTYIAPPVFRII